MRLVDEDRHGLNNAILAAAGYNFGRLVPQFFFHVTTATSCTIADIVKKDFLGKPGSNFRSLIRPRLDLYQGLILAKA